jgi:LuxR family transcriptional regulator, maltose regulon positive regulatory protein
MNQTPEVERSILQTKLLVPRLRPQLVERPRLIQRLNDGAWGRLTLLCAPPGFGKTTLLAKWAHSSPAPVAWLGLDESDNILETFLTYLAASVQTLFPEAGTAALALLRTPQPTRPENFIASLINDLMERKFVLVLDDLHTVSHPAIFAALQYLLDHQPAGMHLIIASRTDPQLSLARWRARGELNELRGNDLRFTADEAANFLNDLMGMKLTPEDIAALEAHTEGWIAGLQMAALSMRDRSDAHQFIQAFTGSNRYVLDYLAEEVLQREPEPIQRFLLKTSILDKLSVPLCAAVLGDTDLPDINATLAYLERSNLFIQPLDDRRAWYRYHNLFADLLRYRLEKTYPDELAGLHRRAAGWYEANGMFEEGVPHFLAAKDLADAARLAEYAGGQMLTEGQGNRFLNWMATLPGELLTVDPHLHLTIAFGLLYIGQFHELEPHLQAAENAIASGAFATMPAFVQQMQAEINAGRALVASTQGDLTRCLELSEKALTGLSQDNSLRPSLLLGMGVAHRLQDQLPQAEKDLIEAAESARQIHLPSVYLSARCNQGSLLIDMGQHLKAQAIFQEVVSQEEASPAESSPVISMAYNGLATLALEWNDRGLAQRYLSSAIETGKRWGNLDFLCSNYGCLAYLRALEGKTDESTAALREMQTHADNSGISSVGRMVAYIWTLKAHLAVDDFCAAWKWTTTHPFTAFLGSSETYYMRPLNLAQCTSAIGCGAQQHDRVLLEAQLKTLEPLAAALEEVGQVSSLIDALAWRAVAHAALGHQSEALAHLEKALRLAAPSELIRTFLEKRIFLVPLLKELRASVAQDDPLHPYLQKLGAAFTGPEDQPTLATGQGLPNPLSEREIEVLRLAATGLSNPQIAERLVLETGTVKRHLHNIFNKLDVDSRAEAIARACQLGLI